MKKDKHDVFSVTESQAMLLQAHTDEGMRDLLEKAYEYFILKGKPCLKKAKKEQKAYEERFAETSDQRRYRLMNTPYGL